MKYGNINDLLVVIKEREQKTMDYKFASAQQKSDQITAKLVEDAKKRINTRRKRLENGLQQRVKNEKARLKIEQQQQLNHHKQKLIEKTLEQCQNYLSNLPKEDYLAQIEQALSLEQDEKPKIIVPEQQYAIVKEHFKNDYLIEIADFKAGFKLIYNNFDLNYDVEELFQYYRPTLSKELVHILFGADNHV